MLAEIVRVTRPGGRIGIVVRAVDMPFWVNLPLVRRVDFCLQRRIVSASINPAYSLIDTAVMTFKRISV
jgi:hypothetical protein